MDKNQKEEKNIEKVIFESLSDEQKEAVRAAFVESKQADARAKNAAVNKTEAETEKLKAEAKTEEANGLKVEAEKKKLTVDKVLAIATLVTGTAIGVCKLGLPALLVKKIQDHHDNEVFKYSDTDSNIERNVTQNLFKWMF